MTLRMPPPPIEQATAMATMMVDGVELPLVEIRSTGDVILDVLFKNTPGCTKSIPRGALGGLRTKKISIPSPRVLYRVRLETLKKQSAYFQIMCKPQFSEGMKLEEDLARLAELKIDPTEAEAEKLPRIKIVDEDVETKTFGREQVFRDMLRTVHGIADPLAAPITTQCLTVLVLMADKYNFMPTIAKTLAKIFANHKYPTPTLMSKNGAEEVLRQKVLVQHYTDQGIRFTDSTRELIVKGSVRWSGYEEDSSEFQTPWWDLPQGLEAELCYRRSCVLRTIASIQNQFLVVYSSKDRQCKLGYDSSGSCDSYQLGEMVKFLTKKGLLSLVPFQSFSPDDPEYIWPEAYTGDIDYLIGLLKQCPSYQIDKHHSHCGLRTKLLPALKYINTCLGMGLGVKLVRSKTGASFESWIPEETQKPKQFWVGAGKGEDVDVSGNGKNFSLAKADTIAVHSSSAAAEKATKDLFTADKWNWITEPEGNARPFFPGGNFIR